LPVGMLTPAIRATKNLQFIQRLGSLLLTSQDKTPKPIP
jgi:hypothetical protein